MQKIFVIALVVASMISVISRFEFYFKHEGKSIDVTSKSLKTEEGDGASISETTKKSGLSEDVWNELLKNIGERVFIEITDTNSANQKTTLPCGALHLYLPGTKIYYCSRDVDICDDYQKMHSTFEDLDISNVHGNKMMTMKMNVACSVKKQEKVKMENALILKGGRELRGGRTPAKGELI